VFDNEKEVEGPWLECLWFKFRGQTKGSSLKKSMRVNVTLFVCKKLSVSLLTRNLLGNSALSVLIALRFHHPLVLRVE
jgi:hypothetical protein